MKKLAVLLAIIILAACSTKQPAEVYTKNQVSLPFKLGKIVYEDNRTDIVPTEVSLSSMPSKENFKTINPEIIPKLKADTEAIIRKAFRGGELEYDVIIVVNKATKGLTKTWQEASESVDIDLTIELTNKQDGSHYKATSKMSNNYDAVVVSDKHAQEMFEITFKNVVYLGLQEVQKGMKK